MNTTTLARQHRKHKGSLLPILLGLDAFFLGGLTALLAVNRLLWTHANRYAPYDMDAASTVLDLIDNLLAYLFPCAGILAFLILATAAVSVWLRFKSRKHP